MGVSGLGYVGLWVWVLRRVFGLYGVCEVSDLSVESICMVDLIFDLWISLCISRVGCG